MDHFFSNILIALGVAATPSPDVWSLYGVSSGYTIDVDLSSLLVRQNNGLEVFSRVRLTPHQELEVKGKTKKGAYYIDSLTAVCKDDKIVLDEVTLYSKDGTVLATQRNLGDTPNPPSRWTLRNRLPRNFVHQR